MKKYSKLIAFLLITTMGLSACSSKKDDSKNTKETEMWET